MTAGNRLERYDPVEIAGCDNPSSEMTYIGADIEYRLHAVAPEQMHQSLIRIVRRSVANDIESRRPQDPVKAVANVF